MSDTYMAPPPASDLVEALSMCLYEQIRERKQELADAKERLAKAQQALRAFQDALDSSGSVAMALYELQRRSRNA